MNLNIGLLIFLNVLSRNNTINHNYIQHATTVLKLINQRVIKKSNCGY